MGKAKRNSQNGGEEKSQSNSLEGSQSRLDSLEVAVSR